MVKNLFRKTGVILLTVAAMLCTGCGAGSGNGNAQSEAVTSHGSEGTSIPETGYCAVGAVDEAAKTAKILLGNGDIVLASYTGDAPKSGVVMIYKRDGERYSFEVDDRRVFPSYGDEYKGRKISVVLRQRSLQSAGKIYVNSETVFFVRYSATEWRVLKGRAAISQNNGGQPGYLLGVAETSGYIWYTNEFDNTAKLALCVMIVGDCAAENEWPPANAAVTKLLDPAGNGFDSGDKDLS